MPSSVWFQAHFRVTPPRRRCVYSCAMSGPGWCSTASGTGRGQVGLPRGEFGKAVRYMLERWEGRTHFVDDPLIPVPRQYRVRPRLLTLTR
jgi:hypothetical protein